jgi:GAF domain-containing protein
MEISVVRKRLSDTIERAKRQAAGRRSRADQASRDFDLFLQKIAVPLFRQVANALKAEGYAFTVFTPSGSVRLMSDRSASDYIELTLDTSEDLPHVMGQVSRERGRRVLDTERAIGTPDTLTEEPLLDFLLKELEAFVTR